MRDHMMQKTNPFKTRTTAGKGKKWLKIGLAGVVLSYGIYDYSTRYSDLVKISEGNKSYTIEKSAPHFWNAWNIFSSDKDGYMIEAKREDGSVLFGEDKDDTGVLNPQSIKKRRPLSIPFVNIYSIKVPFQISEAQDIQDAYQRARRDWQFK